MSRGEDSLVVVLGIDTGLVKTAIAVVSAPGKCLWRGTITVDGDGTGPRFAVLREALDEVFNRVDGPACVAIEEPPLVIFHGHAAGSVLKLYGSFAVAYAEAVRHWPEVHIVGVTPDMWKGTLDKESTETTLRAKYKIECANDHEWDALGLADWAWDTAEAFRGKAKESS
jgi:Holliday junction resolvasome RuvABC endonuclease subunit